MERNTDRILTQAAKAVALLENFSGKAVFDFQSEVDPANRKSFPADKGERAEPVLLQGYFLGCGDWFDVEEDVGGGEVFGVIFGRD